MTWGARRQIVRVNNVSGEEIPPFAAMELSYSGGSCLTVGDDETYWNVQKPTSAGVADPTRIVFNGPGHIPIGRTGEAVIDFVGLVLLYDVGSALSVGATIGPVDGSWYLASSGRGWKLKSRDYSSSPAYTVSSDVKSVYAERDYIPRRHWIGYLYGGYRGVVIGFWVIPTIALDGALPYGPQWVVNIYGWNFGISAATVRVEEDLTNSRWIALQQHYVCPDDREIPEPYPPETPPPWEE